MIVPVKRTVKDIDRYKNKSMDWKDKNKID